MNLKFGGNYLGEPTLIAAARAKGWQTAIIGKEGPARIQDSTATPDQTLIVDDKSGGADGLALPAWFQTGMKSAGLVPPVPGATVPDTAQEEWMAKAATGIVLPHFKDGGKPFILLFWSRDPDFSQHDGKDSIGKTTPGINGAEGVAGTHNADAMLGMVLDRLKALGLDRTTDVFVTADHGFTTITHQDGARQLPNGFLAADLAANLHLPQSAPGVLGKDKSHPEVVVAADGNSDNIYLPGANAKDRAEAIVSFLAGQDYVSGIFVNDALGSVRGALSMSVLNLIGSARTPVPAIYVNFRTSSACANALQCTVGISDTPLATGQGNHGGFSRAETRNFMAAMGPDFKTRFADPAPVSNADIAPTLAQIMGFALPARGKLAGRVASEALPGGNPVQVEKHRVVSEPDPNSGVTTVLEGQSVGDTRYFDAAGFASRTVGLSAN
jgi:arylsulfatase A-like enzyme